MTSNPLDKTDEDTRYLCENVNGEWHLITATTTPYSGECMLGILESAYPMAWFDLVTDRPKVRLDEVDYETFYAYRLELLRPTKHTQAKLIVIDGGKDYDN